MVVTILDKVTMKGVPYIKCFTAAEASAIFKEKTGYEVSAPAVGKLLSGAKIKSEGKTQFTEAVYSGTKFWKFNWDLMKKHVLKKDPNAIFSGEVPDCPLHKSDDIKG